MQDKCNGEISLDCVQFSYPSRPGVTVMSGMTFTASANRTTALVGPSGYGKSTVMSLILRFYHPHSGTVKLDGNEIEKVNTFFFSFFFT